MATGAKAGEGIFPMAEGISREFLPRSFAAHLRLCSVRFSKGVHAELFVYLLLLSEEQKPVTDYILTTT